MKTAFVATVGIGTGPDADIVSPLIKSIKNANPTLLWLIATKESKENAQRILDELGRNEDNSKILELTSKENVSIIFKEVSEIFSNLLKRRYLAENITLDYTTGTKAMSAGAVLSAVKYKCGYLKYIAVRRNEERKPITGTEKFLTIGPDEILASHNMDIATRLIKEYRFDSVINFLNEINQHHLSEREKDVLSNLKHVASAFDKWDKFDHKSFRGEYEKVKYQEPEIGEFKLEKGMEREIFEIGKSLEDKNEIIESVIVDLINNAKRRIEEGKFDDATARLYRTIEMLGQWRLKKKYGIEHSNVDLVKVPEDLKKELESHRDKRDGKIKIGLSLTYELLLKKSDELGKSFDRKKKLKALLKERNESILAHGTKPVSEKSCKRLLEEVEGLAKNFIEKFEELLERYRFPWGKESYL